MIKPEKDNSIDCSRADNIAFWITEVIENSFKVSPDIRFYMDIVRMINTHGNIRAAEAIKGNKKDA